MATDFGGALPPYQRIEEVEDLDKPEKWFEDLDAETEFVHYENEREQRLKRTELLRNSVIVRNIRQPDQLCKELQEVLKGDTIVVGVADEDDIRERDRKEAAQKFNEKQEDADRFQQQAAEYQKLERLARQRLMDQLAAKQKELQAKADDAAVRDRERQEQLNKMLRAAEYKLQATLRSRKGELKTTYGSLVPDNAYTKFATTQVVYPQPLNKRAQFIGKKYEVDWAKAPQPLRIRLDLCRAAKDKLPQGQYVMMTSVWNRLDFSSVAHIQASFIGLPKLGVPAGGHRLQWSCLQNLEDRDLDAKKGKSMFKQVTELLDDKVKAKELTGIISTCSSVSAPVAHAGLWYSDVLRFDQAVYMACPSEKDMTPSMCLVFELYLLRGNVSPVDKVMGWAAFPLVDSDFSLIRGCFKIPMIRGPIDTSVDRYALYERRYRDDIQAWLCNFYFRCDRLPKYSAGQLEYEVQLSYTGKILGLKKKKNAAENKPESGREAQRKADAAVAHLANALKDESTFGENEALEATKDGIHAWKHMGEGNVVYKPLTNPEDFDQYQFSVTSGHTLVISSEFKRKKKYIFDELFGNYNVSSDIKELGLCGFAVIILFLAFWVRIYIHYFGQWLMLSAFRVPIYQFDVSFLTVKVGYVQALLTTDQEAAVVASGPGMSYLVFLFLVGVVALFQKYVGTVPSIVYSFLPSFGLATIFDPELTLIVDVANGHMTGDAFKLYNFFQTKDHNGVIGIVATCLIYAIFTVTALATFYQYVTKIHRHGRIRDTHRRLTAEEPEFFVPLDNEVSLRYLKWVCYKAKLFKGENGHTRRVQVTEFIVDEESQTAVKRMAQLGDIARGSNTEEDDLGDVQLGLNDKSLLSRLFKKKSTTTTTYVCIHTVNPETMSRTLYRHFMRYPSGAIVELSPKEPAQINTTGRPPPTKVEAITYDQATKHPVRRGEVPIGDWVKENFDSKPPALTAGGQAARELMQQTASEQQEQESLEDRSPDRGELQKTSEVLEQQEDSEVRRGSVASSNAPERARGQAPKGILKQKQEAADHCEGRNSGIGTAIVHVSQERSVNSGQFEDDARQLSEDEQEIEERDEGNGKELSKMNYGQVNVDKISGEFVEADNGEVAAAGDDDELYQEEAPDEEQPEATEANEEEDNAEEKVEEERQQAADDYDETDNAEEAVEEQGDAYDLETAAQEQQDFDN